MYKQSDVTLFMTSAGSTLKSILVSSCGVLATIDKIREIYFIGNIKFHIDIVQGFGTFVEIEAIDEDGSIGKDRLFDQCKEYLNLFEIDELDLVSDSYSDLLRPELALV